MYQNCIPAGAEDEDSDYGYDDYDYPRPVLVRRELTLDEKFMKEVEDLDWDEASKLLEQGANIHCRNSANWSPIMVACDKGCKNIIEQLLKNGANPNDDDKRHSALFCLCRSTAKDEDELLACFNLIADKVDVNKLDLFGINALMYAAENNRPKLVSRLIEMGISVNSKDCNGYTPMTYAVRNGHVDVINILKDAGSDLYHEDHRGQTYYDHAKSEGLNDIADLFDEEPEPEDIVTEVKSPYETFISECPDPKDRLYGFSSDAHNILYAINLGHLDRIFKRNDIQLGHLLTFDNQHWENIGIEMSFDRNKITQNVQLYHSKPWSKKTTRFSEGKFTAFLLMQRMSNIIKQLHILSLTTLYLTKKDVKNDPEIENSIKKSLKNLETIKSTILKIKQKALEIEGNHCVTSADYIGPKKPRRKISVKLLTVPALIFSVAFIVSPKTYGAILQTFRIRFSY